LLDDHDKPRSKKKSHRSKRNDSWLDEA